MLNPDFWRGRRVLLTGHTGFKGAWLSLWLERLGAEVTGFGCPPPTTPSLYALADVGSGLTSIEGDVCSLEDLRRAVLEAKPEIVLHLAAQALVRRSLRDPVHTYAVNVMGTANLLEAIRLDGQDVRAVVSVTSDKCYLNREWEWAYREDEPLGGKDPYSSSKACQELVTASYRQSFFTERGIAVATARAGNVFGGGDWAEDRLVPDLMRAAVDGTPMQVRNPAAVRPWQHVLNPLSGYLGLAEHLWDGGEDFASGWNFGPADDDARPVRWIVDRMRERWPGEIVVEYSDRSDAKEAQALKLDSSRARARLGWTPNWALGAGLDATTQWYLGLRAGDALRDLCHDQIERFSSEPPVAA